jgi:hypothetical protein
VLSRRCFGSLFAYIGSEAIGFDDFRRNGLLLPATEDATLRTGMPLHRGPHRRYNEVVLERVGRIEERWATDSGKDRSLAMLEALERLTLLQLALKRRLMNERRRMVLNSKDPLGAGFDFAELDAMAERLWSAT